MTEWMHNWFGPRWVHRWWQAVYTAVTQLGRVLASVARLGWRGMVSRLGWRGMVSRLGWRGEVKKLGD
jgi:hypothetical protein